MSVYYLSVPVQLKIGLRIPMITYEITELTILDILSKCSHKITMHDLFDLVPDEGVVQERAVTFIKTLNQLLGRELVQTNQNSDGLVYWKISMVGKQHLEELLNC